MSRQAREIKLMLEGSINNSEGDRNQYQITNMESVMNAVVQLERTPSTISIQDLQLYRIGHIVNNIRRKLGVESSSHRDMKMRLKKLIQRWQNMAKENDASNAASNGANQNGTTAPRAKEIEEMKSRLQPKSEPESAENGEHPAPKKGRGRGRPRKGDKTEKLKAKSESRRNSPSLPPELLKVPSPKVAVANTPPPTRPQPTPPPPKISPSPTFNPAPTIESIGEASRVAPKVNPVPNDPYLVSKPIDQSSRPPSLPEFNEDDANSSQSSSQRENRKRPRPCPETASHDAIQHQTKSDAIDADASSEPLFSTLERFNPSVSSCNRPQIPATPNPNEIEKAANGDEWEGVSGVRDSRGNFHRWHDEIHLEPEGTEPFLHILPYVDIDLELL